ncbi:tRNA pseudouridine synthase-like 1 [Amphibalanus amphitrite]|uniref:tRNA pseudouridine synthase-like 1 n=1 Tax=Amphibalanus amphitrite TaxID=1232801 RepID=UPI001C911E37|nr:tRNA pseudouridine synthase-like 1 [Amphibalanus amphitrite]XP_043225311.1 tRNA pseudouridine synthase-like 1 [Amphibalanus amphitrite]
MQRYLIFFSYIGTRFRGAQTQLPPNVLPRVPGASRMGELEDRATVQGLFNVALKRFKPLNTPVLVLSSRTDAGVHALSSSGHCDLLHPRHELGAKYQPDFIRNGLNRYFDKAKAEVSVHRVLPVPESVHARYSAAGREYLYRLGVVRDHAWPDGSDGRTVRALTPIGERYRSYVVGGEFCLARVRQCAALLSGEHDFRTFMGSQNRPQEDVRTLRDLQIEITPGGTAVPSPDIDFWNIHFRSQGFLFRQVRRTVGVLVSCGRGKMSLDDVRHMLENPDKGSWNSLAATAPPHGLYLSRVTYRLGPTEGGGGIATEGGGRPAKDKGTPAEDGKGEKGQDRKEDRTDTVPPADHTVCVDLESARDRESPSEELSGRQTAVTDGAGEMAEGDGQMSDSASYGGDSVGRTRG